MQKEQTVIVFPGQGSQKVGMGSDFAQHPSAKLLFEQADDILKFKLSTLMHSGDSAELSLTENTQPALLLAGIAALKVMEDEAEKYLPELASFVAGHSLGEYTALVAAGVLSFEDGISLVRLRGQAMQRAVPVGQGKMAAVLGLNIENVEKIATKANVYIANDNSNGQVVLSGAADAIDSACLIAKEFGAKRAVILPVSAPFHCPMMAAAAEEMASAFTKVEFSAPKLPVVSNITAIAETDGEAFKELLTKQITGTVRWRESMQMLANNGVEHLIELGCGNVLTGLAARCDARLNGVAMSTVADTKAA